MVAVFNLHFSQRIVTIYGESHSNEFPIFLQTVISNGFLDYNDTVIQTFVNKYKPDVNSLQYITGASGSSAVPSTTTTQPAKVVTETNPSVTTQTILTTLNISVTEKIAMTTDGNSLGTTSQEEIKAPSVGWEKVTLRQDDSTVAWVKTTSGLNDTTQDVAN